MGVQTSLFNNAACSSNLHRNIYRCKNSSWMFSILGDNFNGMRSKLSPLIPKGGQFNMFPFVTNKLFGENIGKKINSFVYIAFAISNLLSFLITSHKLYTLTWNGLIWIGFIFNIVALLTAMLFNENHKWN